MTGYGRSTVEEGGVSITCEARSVNHRFLDLALRLPGPLQGLESRLAARVRLVAERGRIEVTLRRRSVGGAMARVDVDLGLARAWLEAVHQLATQLHVSVGLDAATIAEKPGVVTVEDAADPERDADLLERALDGALAALVGMREQEGARLAQDIRSLCTSLSEGVHIVENVLRDAAPKQMEVLRQRVATLLQGAALDEARVVQEVALLADRADVHEEVQRLRSHLQQVDEALTQGGPMGRRLDFLAQELHREVNTLSSKATDLQARRVAVDLKGLVEKVREQAQNVE